MSLIQWHKPTKVRSTKEHNDMFGCEAANGAFVPNMSDKDRKSWKGKITFANTDNPQVEIRKNTFVIVIGLCGYNYKGYRIDGRYCSTKNFNVHIASSGPIQLSFKDWEEFKEVIEEAKQLLLTNQPD
jgi:hypothetical protein